MAFWNASGPGRTATQATSKATAVNTGGMCGQITMNNASLAATTSVSFTLNNGNIGPNDTIAICIASGATASSYSITVEAVAAGSCSVQLRNVTAGALAEALVLNYTILKNGI